MAEFRVTAPRDTSAMGALYGVDVPTPPPAGPFPAANSVDWLQQRLPKALGDWLGNAYAEGTARAGDLSPRTVAGEAITGAMNLMPAGRMSVPRQGIRAYHGSPYDFDRFDMSKIGSGEGHQAYGHGLYFAETPEVAQTYKGMASYKGKLPDDVISLPPEMRQAVTTHALTDADAVTAAKRAQYMNSALRQTDLGQLTDMVQRIRDAKRGKMYEVNINAKPEQFLDWGGSLKEQSPYVQQAFGKLRNTIKQENPLAQSGLMLEDARTNNIPFEDFNRQFAKYDFDPISAAEMTRDAGIPGIRYLDQGSRLTGSGNVERLVESRGSREKAMEFAQSQLGKFAPDRPTHKYWTDIAQELQDYKPRTSNYVLFNDSIIDILKKWGLMGGMAGAGAASQDQSSQ